jgi:hypothetical protein
MLESLPDLRVELIMSIKVHFIMIMNIEGLEHLSERGVEVGNGMEA